MDVTPLVIASKVIVTNLSFGVSNPGDTEPAIESVQLQIPPLRIAPPPGTPPQSVANANFNIVITDKSMMKKLELGKSYKVLFVADDEA